MTWWCLPDVTSVLELSGELLWSVHGDWSAIVVDQSISNWSCVGLEAEHS